MASATVDTNAAADIGLQLHLDSINTIDLDLISQSELYTLSFCSSSTFDPRSCDDLVIPKIDRSVFNESAGSRKQTYSRLRLAPATSPNSPSALRRRGPVIRSNNFNATPPYLDSDPEVAESKQIVGLFKKLLGVEEDNNFGNDENVDVGNRLIPVRVDYSEAMLQTSNASSDGLKRKRGRPSKRENVLALVGYKVQNTCQNGVSIHKIAEGKNAVVTNNGAVDLVDNKVESECENSGVKMAMVNEIVMRGNVDDKEREMVNRDGNVVDLVELCLMEDPYAGELGRRTEGMTKEEELLRFMNDLSGEWVSRRRKRRIVDASEFGNVLPKGWRLMLACRKKDGRIWIYCRRYMSPNGRQFASCKEISDYLRSFHSIQDANQITCAQQILNFEDNNVNDEASHNFEVTNTAVSPVGANEKEDNDVTRFLSQAFASMSGAPRDQQDVQGVSCMNCDSCDLSFNCQDDLLHHQLNSHRRKKLKTSVTDGVIIREGKFECQFCHKSFDERKRYNGHMGSHVRGQGNISDDSRVAAIYKDDTGGPLSVEHSSCKDSIVQTVVAKESNDVATKLSGEGGGNQPKSSLTQGSVDKPGVFNEDASGERLKIDDSMDVDVLETNEDFGFEAALNSGSNEAAKGSVDSSNEREMISIGGLPLPLREQTTTLRSIEVADESKKSSDVEKGISEGCSPPPFVSNEAADVSEKYPNEDERISEGCSPLLLDKQTGSFNEASSSEQFCNEQERPSEECSPLPLDKQMGCFDDMINGLFESNRETISGSALPSSNENMDSCDIDWDSTVFSHTMDELGLDGNKTGDNDTVLGFCDKNGVANGHDESHIYGTKEHARSVEFDRNTVNHLGKDNSAEVNEQGRNEILSDHLNVQKQSKSLFLSSFGADNHADKVSSRMMQEHQGNHPQIENNAGIGFPFPTSNNVPIMPTVLKDTNDTNFGFRSFFPSQNGKLFSADVNRGSLQISTVEESKEQLYVQETPQEVYSTNKIFPTNYNNNGNIGSRNSNNNGLCLAFGSQTNSSVNQMEQYGAKGFGGVHPIMDQTYGVSRNINNFGRPSASSSVAVNNPMEGGRGFRSGLHDSSFIDKSSKFGNAFDLGYSGRLWDGIRLDQTGNSSNKFMADFVNTNPQPVADLMSRSIWQTSEADFMQNSVNTAPPLSQPLNNFHTFDILSEKTHGRLFEADQKYNNNGSYEGLTLGRTQPTEYTFMASTQNSNSLPGGSKGFSYNVQATQPGFNPSYWQGKDALMPSMAVQNRVRSVCVWCRKEIYDDDSLPSAGQSGALGSMCADCRLRYPPQFNVL